MIKKPVTQEEKKLVGYLTKKKKQSGKSPHVYNNKRKDNEKSNYLSGKFYSKKNKKSVFGFWGYTIRLCSFFIEKNAKIVKIRKIID